MHVIFTVSGEPRGKGRPRFSRLINGRTMAYTPKKTVEYEEAVRNCYMAQCGLTRFAKSIPLAVSITAYYGIPSSASARRRAQMENQEILPTRKPDADNVVKCICDALNGVAYHDDSQIVEVCFKKYYSVRPRAVVVIQNERGETE